MQRNYGSNRAATLQDLLNYSDAQPQSSVAVPAPPDASRVDGGGGFDPQERQRLIDMLLTPDNVGDAPQVDKPNAMSLLFTGLGDALSAHVAGNTGNPGMRTNAMDQYLRNIEMQKAEKRAYDERRGAAANRAKDRTANYLLSEMDRKQELATAAAAKKEMLAYRTAQEQQAAAQEAARLAQAKAINDADNATRLQIEKMGNDNRAALAGAEARLHADRAKGEGDKAQHGVYVQLKGAIVAKKREYEQALAEGKITPEQVLAEWQDIRDAVDLDPNGPYAAAADAFFQDKIGPVLMKYAPQQGPAQGAPYDKAAFAAGAAQLPLDTSQGTMMQQGNQLLRRAP